jgi:hypothetical protein
MNKYSRFGTGKFDEENKAYNAPAKLALNLFIIFAIMVLFNGAYSSKNFSVIIPVSLLIGCLTIVLFRKYFK